MSITGRGQPGTYEVLRMVGVACPGLCYRKARWLPGAPLWEAKAQLLRKFLQRRAGGLPQVPPLTQIFDKSLSCSLFTIERSLPQQALQVQRVPCMLCHPSGGILLAAQDARRKDSLEPSLAALS